MKTRKRVRLRPRLDEDLNDYVNAAKASASAKSCLAAAAVIGAIGLGSLAVVPDLNAEIVYTPTNQSIGKSGFERSFFSTLPVDLNNDGIPDFTLSAFNLASFSSHISIIASLWAAGVQSNQILQNNSKLALANAPGHKIGPPTNTGSQFGRLGLMAVFREIYSAFGSGYRKSSGFWLNATNRYLGIKFFINGETHYGWARLIAHAGFANLTGYAYETIPDKPIPAGMLDSLSPESTALPAPSGSLGELALGASRTRRGA